MDVVFLLALLALYGASHWLICTVSAALSVALFVYLLYALAGSVAAANYQAARVARSRGLPLGRVQTLIGAHTEGRLLAVLGEPRVNVLELNLALDALK